MILREYQQEAVLKALEKIKEEKVPYLALQPRCGKTITALTVANKIGEKSVLFITKKKAMDSIKEDFKKSGFDYFLTVTNYEQVHKLKPIYKCVIVDEAHNLGKYPKPSLRTKRVKLLCKGATVILLSGTPNPESFSQLYHQLWLSDYSPFKQYKTFYKWAKDYVNIKKKKINATQEVNDYSEIKPELQPILKDLFITVTQQEAGFIQTIQEVFHTVEMKEDTKEIFKQLRKHRVIQEPQVTADTAGKLLQKCHQLVSGSIITDAGIYKINDNSKIDYIFKTFANQKIAIFYKFKSELSMILTGGFHYDKVITELPGTFCRTGNDCIFAGQFTSIKEGLDLQLADCIIMFNIDFSAVSYMQSINRLQSKDREKPAVIHWIFSDLGLEQKIYTTVKEKQKNYTGSIFMKQF